MRNLSAAPGMDGLRTLETFSLPEKVFDAVAWYFQQVEMGMRALPHSLVRARQALLNKGSGNEPLQKTCIALLPSFLVGYTGLGYRQLQQWQQGIKGRQMLSLRKSNSVVTSRAELECRFMALTLDKAKAFDRVIPSVAGLVSSP